MNNRKITSMKLKGLPLGDKVGFAVSYSDGFYISQILKSTASQEANETP